MIYTYNNKSQNIDYANRYLLAKTLSMFDYEGLPDTIPEQELERILQEKGLAFIYEYKGELYAFSGTLTGDVDMYNRPKEITINIRQDHKTKTLPISDGVLVCNDDYKLGLLPLINKYNTLLTENEITIMMYNLNNRIHKIISASDDITKESAKKYLDEIEKGNLAIIGESKFLQDLKVQGGTTNQGQGLGDLIEYNKYLKATLYNEVGIQSNINTKKERLITAEVEQNQELLYPFINNMYNNRVLAVQQLNEKYNLNIEVTYGSIWINRKDKNNVIETMENQTGTNEPNQVDEPTRETGNGDKRGNNNNPDTL